jgi:CDP-glycerol glycerophosphotransferase (TagB/SpsB family)
MSSPRKRLLFSVPYGLAFRAVVATGLVRECVEQGHSARLLLPRLAAADQSLIRGQIPADVSIGHLRTVPRTARLTLLKFFKQHLYNRRTGSRTFAVKREERRRRRPVFHLAASIAERAAELCLTEGQVDGWLAAAPQPFEREYSRDLQDIDALVITKPGYHPDELPLIRAAKRQGIPVVSVDTTWDNVVSKRPAYICPDVVTVWNPLMQSEVVSYYGLEPGAVPITGGPQFDVFAHRSELPPRDDFIQSLGLDSSRKLIVFALNNPTLTPANPSFVAAVAGAARSTDDGRGANLVVRLHPWDRDSDYEDFVRKNPHVRVEHAFGRPSSDSVFECLATREDVGYYGALITHADALVNIASTATLDAIAADRPAIHLAFDPHPVAPEESIARFCEFTHFHALIRTGAVALVRSEDELQPMIDAALARPEDAAAARAQARRQFLTYSDGRSGARVVDAIIGAGGARTDRDIAS